MTIDPIVLLVDDNPSDALLMDTVFQRTGYEHPLRCVSDGEDAIAYLQGEGRYANRSEFPLPTIVLLDLNMPRKNGFEVLAWIRRHPTLGRIHVFILSSSSRPQDIDKAYELGANAYLVRPGNLDELLYLAKTLVTWLKLCQFATVADPRYAEEALAGQYRR